MLSNSGFFRRLAVTSVLVFRREAARALPRPSASASAKVEKITVNQSHSETKPVNQTGSELFSITDITKVTRVITLAISTQNMTGLRHRVRGSSFLKDSKRAGRTIRGSKIEMGSGGCL